MLSLSNFTLLSHYLLHLYEIWNVNNSCMKLSDNAAGGFRGKMVGFLREEVQDSDGYRF